MTKKEIVDIIYKTYGTDSGVLFGITERAIVETIVEFTLKKITHEPKQAEDNWPIETSNNLHIANRELNSKKKNNLTFNEYHKQAIHTKIYPKSLAIPYVTIGLSGEVGEICEKVKKVIRDNNCIFTEEKKQELGKEIGDVLWYLACMCDELNLDFNQVAQQNLDKLNKRKEEGKLSGSGDNR